MDDYGNGCEETVAELRRQLAECQADADAAIADAIAQGEACRRAEAERDALKEWKEAVPVAALWEVYHLTASRFEYECVASWLPLPTVQP